MVIFQVLRFVGLLPGAERGVGGGNIGYYIRGLYRDCY